MTKKQEMITIPAASIEGLIRTMERAKDLYGSDWPSGKEREAINMLFGYVEAYRSLLPDNGMKDDKSN